MSAEFVLRPDDSELKRVVRIDCSDNETLIVTEDGERYIFGPKVVREEAVIRKEDVPDIQQAMLKLIDLTSKDPVIDPKVMRAIWDQQTLHWLAFVIHEELQHHIHCVNWERTPETFASDIIGFHRALHWVRSIIASKEPQ
jgi:hypothetical protein